MFDMKAPRGVDRVKDSVFSHVYVAQKVIDTVLLCLPCRAARRCGRPPWVPSSA